MFRWKWCGKNKLFKQPAEIFNIVSKNLTNSKKKIVFILNWPECVFNLKNQNIIEENLKSIIALTKAIRNSQISWMNEKIYESGIIIITNKILMLPTFFYKANPEVGCITLSKPDYLEREAMLEKIEDDFNIKKNYFENLMSNKKSSEYVDMLDNFTNREIIQMAKLSKKEKEKLNFEELFCLFKYGQKENPWEKLDYQKIKNIETELTQKVIGQ